MAVGSRKYTGSFQVNRQKGSQGCIVPPYRRCPHHPHTHHRRPREHLDSRKKAKGNEMGRNTVKWAKGNEMVF